MAASVGIGLLASYPSWFILASGTALVLILGLAGELPLLAIAIFLSGISFNFLSGGADPAGANLDGLRLAALLGGFSVAVIKRPSLLSYAKGLGIYLLFVAYAAISVAWSPSATDGLRLLAKLVYPVAIFLLTWRVLTEHGEQIIVRLVLVGVLAATVLNVSVAVLGLSPWSSGGYAGRFGGASHPNTIGLFCAVAGLILYSTARRSMVVVLTIGACLVQLVATGSRTAVVAGGLGLIAMDGLRRKWPRVVLALLVGAALWTLAPEFGQRTAATGADVGLSPFSIGSGLNFSGRMTLWSDAWTALMGDDQVIGRGLGATDLFFGTRYAGLRSIHNGYLLLLVDVGVIGALLCVLFYGHRLVCLTRDIVSADRISGRAPLAVALLIVFLVASLMESTFAGYAFPSLLWLSLAWAGWSQQGEPRGTVT